MLPFDHQSGANALLAPCHPALLVFATSRQDLPVQLPYIRGFRDRNPVVPPEVPGLSLYASLLMRLGGLQNSLSNRQCERNAMNRAVSSRWCPRKIFFTAEVRLS